MLPPFSHALMIFPYALYLRAAMMRTIAVSAAAIILRRDAAFDVDAMPRDYAEFA